MALKFRRGTTAQKSGSLSFGEPYVNTTLGTLQIGLDTGDVTLLINSASQGISGSSLDITGNAKIDGNLTLGGNITIGDQTTDTVTVTANLSSSLIPQTTDAFDLGSVDKIWRDLYISTGSIKFVQNGSVISTLSVNGNGSQTFPSGAIITGSLRTSGSNNFIGNQTITGSLFVTGSNIEFKRDWPAVGTESHFLRLEPFTSSTNRYYDGLSIGVEHWDDGTGTYEHSLLIHSFDDDTVQNYGAELNVGPYRTHMRVYPSGSNGQMSNISVQELSNGKTQALVYGDYVQIGAFVGQEIIIGNTTASVTISGSISSSQISQIQSATSSFANKFNTLASVTASLNSYTSSNDTTNTNQNNRLNRLEESTSSLNSFTSSINTTIKNRLDAETVISGSSQVTLSATTGFTSYSSSVDSRILTEKGRIDAILSASSADADTFAEIVTLINSVDTTNDNAFASFYTASVNRLNNLESTSGSNNISISNINSFTSSINTTIKDRLNVEGVVSSSAQVVGILSSLNTYTGSNDTTNSIQNSRLDQLSSYTASNDTTNTTQNSRLDQLSTASGSAVSRLNTLESETLNLELFTSSINTTIKSKLDVDGVISGSSQLTSSLVQVSQTSSMTVLAAATVTVAASNTLNDSTLYPTFTNNIANGTTQLKSHPSGTFYFDGTTRKVYGEAFVGAIEATNGVVSGSSQLTSSMLATTGSNTFVGTQTISGSILPALDNTYDLGSQTKIWRDLYISTGSIRVVADGTVLSSITTNSDGSQTFPNGLYSQANIIIGSGSYTSIGKFQVGRRGDTPDNNTVLGIDVMPSLTTGEFNTGLGRGTLYNLTTGGNNIAIGNQAGYSMTNGDGNITIGASAAFTLADPGGVNGTPVVNTYIGNNAGTYVNSGFWTTAIGGNTLMGGVGTTDRFIKNTAIGYNAGNNVTGTSSNNIYIGVYAGPSTSTSENYKFYISNGESGAQPFMYGNMEDGSRTLDINTSTTISGSLRIKKDLIIEGSSSIENISSSNLIIGGAYVTLNTATPSSRYAGLQIIDSGSSGGSGSFLYDAVHDEFVFVHRGNGTNVTSSHFILGPETYDDLGNETYLTNNRLPKGTGNEHLVDSNITDTGTLITLGSNAVVNGTFYATGTTLVSGSQQVIDILASLNTYTGSNDTTNTLQTTRINQLAAATASVNSFTESVLGHIADINTYTGSNNTLNNLQTTRIDQLAAATASVNSFTSSIDTTIKTKLNVEGVVSGSSQITLSATTGYGTVINQNLLTTSDVRHNSLGIGMAASTTAGRIDAAGDIVAFSTSDRNFKENITPIPNALEKISKISGNTYDWKSDMKEYHGFEGNDVGVIAQEIEEVLPQLVTTRETGYKAVKYDKLVALLIEGIKEQQQQIHSLTLEVQNLKKQKGL